MNILYKKKYLISMYLFSEIFMLNTSYAMDQDKTTIIVQNKKNVTLIDSKTETKKENFRKNIKYLSEEDLESEDGRLASSTINRPDKFWIDESGKQKFLEAM